MRCKPSRYLLSVPWIVMLTCTQMSVSAAGNWLLHPGCIANGPYQAVNNTIPPTLYASAASGGSGGSYSYQWQSSTDNIHFINIPGATSQHLSFSATLSQDTYFQRRTICGAEVSYTNSVLVDMVAYITYYSAAVSDVFTRNNCESPYEGTDTIFTVSANTFTSTVSQHVADSIATAYLYANGQAYANSNAECVVTLPTPRLEYGGTELGMDGWVYGELTITCYENFTVIPVVVNNLTIYMTVDDPCGQVTCTIPNCSQVTLYNTSSLFLGNAVMSYEIPDGMGSYIFCPVSYYLAPGPGYLIN